MVQVDINDSVYNICTAHPEAIEILRNLGFKDIAASGMLQTAGRFMTIPKASALKKIPLEKIKEEFYQNGIELTGGTK